MWLHGARVVPLAALMAASATTACSSTNTQTSIRSAEAAADVRALAAATLDAESPPAGGKGSTAALDDAALDRPLDLAALEATVLSRQPSLTAATHRIRALAERARAEGKLPPPEIMADIWQIPFAKPYAIDKAGMIMFSIRQQFPAPGVLDKMSEAMALEAQAEVEKAIGEARSIVREVDKAYADYAEATERHRAHDTHMRIVEQMVAAARARYETRGMLGDVTRAELERARTHVDIQREQGMIDESRAKLNGLLARSAEAKLGAPKQGELVTAALSADQAAALAASRSPEVRMAERMAKSARASADAARREAEVPMFSAGFSTFMPVNDMPAGYGLSFGMSLPWAWGAASARARSAEQKALAEQAATDGARVRMRTDAATSLAAVRTAERRYVGLRDGALPAAHRALEATRAGYAAGGSDILMWLDAARMALDIELDLAMARGALERALADLDFAVGARVPRAAIPAPKEPGHDH
jgi:outer membrane protein TolC